MQKTFQFLVFLDEKGRLLVLCVFMMNEVLKMLHDVAGSYQQKTGEEDCLPCPMGFEAR